MGKKKANHVPDMEAIRRMFWRNTRIQMAELKAKLKAAKRKSGNGK